MKIAVIYGTGRKGKSSTYNIAQKFKENLAENDDVKEFFLPKDMPNYCRGCMQCFEDRAKCPDYTYLEPIYEAIKESELIIFTAPVYVFHVPGQVKTFLDHFGHQWMVHRPQGEMFKKAALIISTAAGSGTKSTIKDVEHSMEFWGIGRIYSLGFNVFAMDWEGIKEDRKRKLLKRIDSISDKIRKNLKRSPTSLKTKMKFNLYRQIHKRVEFTKEDAQYWKESGWLKKKRPWK